MPLSYLIWMRSLTHQGELKGSINMVLFTQAEVGGLPGCQCQAGEAGALSCANDLPMLPSGFRVILTIMVSQYLVFDPIEVN